VPHPRGLLRYTSKKLVNVQKTEDVKIAECTIKEDNDKNLWICSKDNGIYKYDGKIWTHYTKKDSLYSDHVCSMVIDNEGHLWAAHYKGGLSYFDGVKWICIKMGEHYYAPSINGTGTMNIIDGLMDGGKWENFPTQIMFDGLNNLWVTCQGGGVFRYNGKLWELIQQLSPSSGVEMIKDSRGNIWVTNYALYGFKPAEGLFKFEIKNKTWISKLKMDIRNLFEDDKGNIWGTCLIGHSYTKEEIYCFPNE
jgi:ligand-binding sensor domain-containing protein